MSSLNTCKEEISLNMGLSPQFPRNALNSASSLRSSDGQVAKMKNGHLRHRRREELGDNSSNRIVAKMREEERESEEKGREIPNKRCDSGKDGRQRELEWERWDVRQRRREKMEKKEKKKKDREKKMKRKYGDKKEKEVLDEEEIEMLVRGEATAPLPPLMEDWTKFDVIIFIHNLGLRTLKEVCAVSYSSDYNFSLNTHEQFMT